MIINLHFFTFRHHHMKPTNQRKPSRPRVSRFGLEIWNRGDDMIFKRRDSFNLHILHFKKSLATPYGTITDV
jgi:hypothetical protein